MVEYFIKFIKTPGDLHKSILKFFLFNTICYCNRILNMCGRFALKNFRGVEDLFSPFNIPVPEMEGRYNISPGSFIPGLLSDMTLHTDIFWGMKPPWMKNQKLLINARSETIREKSTFKKHIKQHRMIIPASGFYEWKTEANKKIPYYITDPEDKFLAIAGIYRINENKEIQCAIVTTRAGISMSSVHDRQPVLLKSDAMKDWLFSEDDTLIDSFFMPFDHLKPVRVSTYVNHSENEGEKCILPDDS